MRSSKSRSRNKNNNRNRSHNQSGNNMNRVFDSSGPEGKVRGTPQQIIEKYSQLARDATLGDDRVAAENFQQHSEHYTRMLAEAQIEIDAKREQQEREHRERQQARADQPRHDNNQGGNNQGGNNQAGNDQGSNDQPQGQRQPSQQQENVQKPHDLSQTEQPDVVQPMAEAGDSGLVETPEQAPVKKPRARRKPKPVVTETVETTDQPEAPKAAE